MQPSYITVDIKTLCAIAGMAVGAFALLPYLADTLRGKTKPHAFSWFIWGVLAAIACIGQQADAAGPGGWITGLNGAVCFVLAALALRFGEKTVTRGDMLTFGAAMLAIPLWLVTKTPLYAMLLVSLIDALGFYPTFRKSWAKPHEETVLTHACSGISYVLSFAALTHYSAVTMLYPVSLIVTDFALMAFILWRRKVLAR